MTSLQTLSADPSIVWDDYPARRPPVAPGPRSGSGAGVSMSYIHNGLSVAPAFMESVLANVAAGSVRNVLPVGIGSDPAGIVAGRNYGVKQFLATRPEEWFCWVDTDAVFGSDMVARLLRSAHPQERPIVGGLCFGLKSTPDGGRLPYPTLFDVDANGYRIMWDYPRDTLVEVAATGSHAILIHRMVLERIGSGWYDIAPAPNLLEDGTPDKLGEDMSFCQRARQAGYKVHVDTSVKTGHVKAVTLSEANYAVPEWAAHLKAMLPPSTLRDSVS